MNIDINEAEPKRQDVRVPSTNTEFDVDLTKPQAQNDERPTQVVQLKLDDEMKLEVMVDPSPGAKQEQNPQPDQLCEPSQLPKARTEPRTHQKQ